MNWFIANIFMFFYLTTESRSLIYKSKNKENNRILSEPNRINFRYNKIRSIENLNISQQLHQHKTTTENIRNKKYIKDDSSRTNNERNLKKYNYLYANQKHFPIDSMLSKIITSNQANYNSKIYEYNQILNNATNEAKSLILDSENYVPITNLNKIYFKNNESKSRSALKYTFQSIAQTKNSNDREFSNTFHDYIEENTFPPELIEYKITAKTPTPAPSEEWSSGAYNFLQSINCSTAEWTTVIKCQDIQAIEKHEMNIWMTRKRSQYFAHLPIGYLFPAEVYEGVIMIDPYPEASWGHLVLVFLIIGNKPAEVCENLHGFNLCK